MKPTDAKLMIRCADCKEELELHYSHEAIIYSTHLSEYIIHDATKSSDWYLVDGNFYCSNCRPSGKE